MRDHTRHSEAGQLYVAAYEAHYSSKDPEQALKLYHDIMTAHPETQEAEYSRSQIHNIAMAVVPKQEIFDAEMNLALAHFKHGDPAQTNMDLSC